MQRLALCGVPLALVRAPEPVWTVVSSSFRALEEKKEKKICLTRHEENVLFCRPDKNFAMSSALYARKGCPICSCTYPVVLDFECSTICPIMPGLIGIWQKRLGIWPKWWNTQIKVNPAQVHVQMEHPVVRSIYIGQN